MNKQIDIKWFPLDEVLSTLSVQERSWLFNEDSLTKRLNDLSLNCFSVEVLLEDWQTLRADEYLGLVVDTQNKGWVREVFLKGAGEPWVFARSVAMQVGLNNPLYDLTTLGDKPLGSILFMDDSFRRTPLEIALYPSELLPDPYHNGSLWGRRSSFINEDLAILVQEIFLPPFWRQL